MFMFVCLYIYMFMITYLSICLYVNGLWFMYICGYRDRFDVGVQGWGWRNLCLWWVITVYLKNQLINYERVESLVKEHASIKDFTFMVLMFIYVYIFVCLYVYDYTFVYMLMVCGLCLWFMFMGYVYIFVYLFVYDNTVTYLFIC